MLVDPKFINIYGDVFEDSASFGIPELIRPGMYMGSMQIENTCSVKLKRYHDQDEWGLTIENRMKSMNAWMSSPEYIPDHGMCDDEEQFLRRFPHILTCEKKCLVAFTFINKKDEPSSGGFRPHKNGAYYGEQKFEGYEYFVDESNMTHMCLFEVYEVTDIPNDEIPPESEWAGIQERARELRIKHNL